MDDLQDQNQISMVDKEASALIAQADSFIKKHNLALPSTQKSEKQQVLAQAKIDDIQNSLNLLDDKLNSLE